MPRESKKKILSWADFPAGSTGFGKVNRYIMRALYDTSRYDIKLLAINYFGQFYDLEKYPYQTSPAKLLDPNDPYGNRMLLRVIQEEAPFDAVFILNDTYAVSGVAKELRKVIRDRQLPTKIIYYYPVDSAVLVDNAGMLLEADKLVAYTNWGRERTLDVLPDLEPPEVIYHGTDTDIFKPLDANRRRAIRREYLKITDDSTFLIINVNRNSLRKDLARTVLAYSEFKKKVPNSLLYLHTSVRDQMLDLMPAIKQLGLEIHHDVLFPENYSPISGVPEEVLNLLYNAADVCLTTSLGEGWGLSQSEGLAAGTLVISGNHSSTPEILGQDGERGLVYPCKELVWIDNSAYRPIGHLEDIVAKLHQAHDITLEEKFSILERGRDWANTYSWKNIGEAWVGLFDKVLDSSIEKRSSVILSEDL